MYNYAEETVNVSALIRQILVNYLMFTASGGSLDEFLAGSQEVSALVDRYDTLNERVLDTLVQLDTERVERLQADALREAQPIVNNAEAIELIARALELLASPTPQVEEETPQPVVAEAPQPVVEEAPQVTVATATTEATAVEFADEDFDEIEDEILEEEILAEIDEDFEFNLDDEDLDTSSDEVQEQVEVDLIKNPDIVEGFVSIEDTNMVMLVFVKYSHLPYHYTVDGARYKFVVNGSQIISTLV